MPQGLTEEPAAGEDLREASLAALIARAERAGVGAPPVEHWNPASCGEIDMVIRANGAWVHEGRPIVRDSLVRLFSSVLRKDADGCTYLVTPAEKLKLTVEDSPFLAVEMNRRVAGGEPVITFRTNVGDVVEAGPAHPLRLDAGAGDFRPYLGVRGRLEAKLTRALAFDLADWIEEVEGALFIRSNGARFAVPAAGDAA